MSSDMVLMPKKLTAENGAKKLFIGEFFARFESDCINCGGEGCDGCNGFGTFIDDIPISWSTIKDIYDMAVEHLSQPVI